MKEITRLAKDIPTVASRWRAWEKYTEDRLVTSEAGANLDNVSDFVTTRALRVAQLTIYRDLYLEALGGSTNSWPHDISNDIEKVLPKHHRRVDNESGYNAKLVLGDAQQMIMPSEEFYTQWTIVRFHPFVMRDDLPTNLRTQISSYFDFGFMLPPQQ